jgi:hypothetical protein
MKCNTAWARVLAFLLVLASRTALADEAKAPAAADTPALPTEPGPVGPIPGLYADAEEIGSGDRPWFLPGRAAGSLGYIYTYQNWKDSFAVKGSAGTDRQLTSTITNQINSEYFVARYDHFSILAPQIANGTIAILGGLQQSSSDVNGVSTRQNGTLLGYDFSLSCLDESAYPGSIYANRGQASTTLPYGGTEDTLTENRGLIWRILDTSILRDREILPYFSASLEAYQERAVTTTTIAGQSAKRDDNRDIVRLAADNGTETSDLSFRYLLTRFTDRYYGTNSYQNQNAVLDYSLDFGPGLNSTWFSQVQYSDYYGSSVDTNSEIRVQEDLTVLHTTRLTSYYDYTYDRQEGTFGNANGTLNTQNGSAQLQYAPFNNLSAYLNAAGFTSTFPNGSLDGYGLQFWLNYGHDLPWEGAMNAGLGLGYLITDSHTPGGIAPVINAPYIAPPSFGVDQQILLRDLFIVTSSIRVIAIKKDGARLTAQEGVDYLIVVVGYRTYLQPLATSLVIQPSDPLQVSYSYAVPPQLKYQTTTRNYTLGFAWPWISATYNHSESDSVPLVGGDSSQIVTFKSDELDLALNGTWGNLQARADARYYNFDSTGLDYRRLWATELLQYAPTQETSIQLTASQVDTTYTVPVRTSRGQSVQLAFTYARGFWTSNGYILGRRMTDTLVPTEQYEEAGLRWQARWGKLSGNVSFFGSQRQYAGFRTNGFGGQLSIVRDF